MKTFTQELLHIELNASSSARTVYLAKAKAIAHHLNYATTFLATISCHATWKFKRALQQNEEPCRAKTTSNVKF